MISINKALALYAEDEAVKYYNSLGRVDKSIMEQVYIRLVTAEELPAMGHKGALELAMKMVQFVLDVRVMELLKKVPKEKRMQAALLIANELSI